MCLSNSKETHVTFAINQTLRLQPNHYFHDVVPKKQIYLHHTVGGSGVSTFKYWDSQDLCVATAYIVERDGTIYEVFPPEAWAWHLGLKTSSNTIANKQSIGIEIASEGALRSGNELNTMLAEQNHPALFDPDYLYAFDIDVPPFSHAKRLYHMYDDKDKFIDLAVRFRGYGFFDAYDPTQTPAVMWLVNHLCEELNVPKQLIPGDDKLRFDESLILGFTGVLTHANVRSDKSDVDPSWPWDQLQASFG